MNLPLFFIQTIPKPKFLPPSLIFSDQPCIKIPVRADREKSL